MRRAAVVLGLALLPSTALQPGSAERAIYDQIAWVAAGRPAKSTLAYSGFADSGRTRLFVAPSCYPD